MHVEGQEASFYFTFHSKTVLIFFPNYFIILDKKPNSSWCLVAVGLRM